MKFLGHPIHPILIAFPLGLLSTSVVFDILYLLTSLPAFPVAAVYTVAAGVLSGVAAMFFGLLDMFKIRKETRAMNIVGWHSLGNFLAIELFSVSWIVRLSVPGYAPNGPALVLSFAGAAILLFTGWLGGELVYRLGLAVDESAHMDAPNSLTHKVAK
jgi:uncharacterized membrane protein